MSDRARDPFVAARAFAAEIALFAPPVPTIEPALGRLGPEALARFRLGSVPSQGWAPSLAVVGRRGAGKSSLALRLVDFASTGDRLAVSCAQPSWGGTVLAHDTPGLRAAGRPKLRDQLRDALAPDPPEVLIAVFSATEVDAGIDDDVADLVALTRAWTLRRGHPPALLVALHRVDELPPFDRDPAVDDPERAHAIATATRVLRVRLAPLGPRGTVVATATPDGASAPVGVGELQRQARTLLASRLGDEVSRTAAFERCLDRLRKTELPQVVEGATRARRAWGALDAPTRSILLHPRGWATGSEGRSERG